MKQNETQGGSNRTELEEASANLLNSTLNNNTKGMEDHGEGAIFRVTRTPVLPKSTREFRINRHHFHQEQRPAALADPANQVCSVRVYSGARRIPRVPESGHDNLENFPLRLDQLEEPPPRCQVARRRDGTWACDRALRGRH